MPRKLPEPGTVIVPKVETVRGLEVRDYLYPSGLREIAVYVPGERTASALATRQPDVTRWACYGSANARPDLLTKVRKVAVAFIVNAARKADPHA